MVETEKFFNVYLDGDLVFEGFDSVEEASIYSRMRIEIEDWEYVEIIPIYQTWDDDDKVDVYYGLGYNIYGNIRR